MGWVDARKGRGQEIEAEVGPPGSRRGVKGGASGETLGSKSHLGLWTVVRVPTCQETRAWVGEGHKEALDTRNWGEVMVRGGGREESFLRPWRTGKNLSKCYL